MDDSVTVSIAEERESNARMIADSAAAALGSDFERIRAPRFDLPGFDRARWREFAALGWLALRLPEARGGLGMGMSEYCALARELGRALAPEPVIDAVAALEFLPDDLIAPVLEGERIVLPAFAAGTNPQPLLRNGRLSGEALYVGMAAGADAFMVETREGGAAIVEADAPGLTLQAEMTHDGGHQGRLSLDEPPAIAIAHAGERAREDATLATAAYLLGVAARAFEISLDYVKQRKQFDRPIGAFQALQHRLVDQYLQINLLKAALHEAAATIDAGAGRSTAQAMVSRARHRADLAARLVCREAIQLHGAIGFTDEGDAGLFLRKTMALSGRYGTARTHRMRAFAARKEDA